jgi:hypothetical protein
MGDAARRRLMEFGCDRCWPNDAVAAWQVRSEMMPPLSLIDESHYSVTILGCHVCSQRFVSVFTETIDWTDGDDPQSWTLLPITTNEAEELIKKGDQLQETTLNALGWQRRSLRVEHPKGGARRVFWGTGISVGPHD